MNSSIYFTVALEAYVQDQIDKSWAPESCCLNLVINDRLHLDAPLLQRLNQRAAPFLITLGTGLLQADVRTCTFFYTLVSLHTYHPSKIILLETNTPAVHDIEMFFAQQGEALLLLPLPAGTHQAHAVQQASGLVRVGEALLQNALQQQQFYQDLTTQNPLRAVLADLRPDALLRPMEAVLQDRNAFYSFEAVIRLAAAQMVLEQEQLLQRQRAQLYLDFVHIGKKVQQKEYYDLLEWYRNEYEVLPLWYKRFGHIIKVLQGKRSFRSLFKR